MDFTVFHHAERIGEVKKVSMTMVDDDRIKISGTWKGVFSWPSGDAMPRPLTLRTDTMTLKNAAGVLLDGKKVEPLVEFKGRL